MQNSFALGLRGIRETNLSRVLLLIHASKIISRAEIVRCTGLSATTVSALVDVLLQSGFVREVGSGESSGGRPPVLVEFNYSFRHLLGVDMGATHLTVVLMNLAGIILAHRFHRHDVANDPNGTIAALSTLVTETLAAAGQSPANILGMGVAVPAPLAGRQLDQPSSIILPKWEGYNLVGALQSSWLLPIYVENDANAAAIAEKWWGKGKNYSNLAHIKLGTGIGGGLITGGVIYRGDGGTAGEIGHTTIDLNGPLCRCGKRGCLEGYIGAPALIAQVQRLRQERDPDKLGPAGPQYIDDIVEAARQGDPLCREVVEQAGRYLGVGIANLLNLLNPGLITLGGALPLAGDYFLEAVRSSVRERAIPKAAQEAKIVVSSLGDDDVAIGAATIVLQRALEPGHVSELLPR